METILIVDDEKNYLTILSALLEEEGYEVLSAPGGRVAIRVEVRSASWVPVGEIRLWANGELLARSGLAQRTYTIIGQGLIDQALSLRADERRMLFEEAAGVSHYKQRRAETLTLEEWARLWQEFTKPKE